MKKFLAILLVVCFAVSLCACASMDTFRKRLQDLYTIEYLTTNDLEDFTELMNTNADEYEVRSIMNATHIVEYYSVVIIECGSKAKAKNLETDLQTIVDLLEYSYDESYSFDAQVKGRFVLIGEVRAINDALGK